MAYTGDHEYSSDNAGARRDINRAIERARENNTPIALVFWHISSGRSGGWAGGALNGLLNAVKASGLVRASPTHDGLGVVEDIQIIVLNNDGQELQPSDGESTMYNSERAAHGNRSNLVHFNCS